MNRSGNGTLPTFDYSTSDHRSIYFEAMSKLEVPLYHLEIQEKFTVIYIEILFKVKWLSVSWKRSR